MQGLEGREPCIRCPARAEAMLSACMSRQQPGMAHGTVWASHLPPLWWEALDQAP